MLIRCLRGYVRAQNMFRRAVATGFAHVRLQETLLRPLSTEVAAAIEAPEAACRSAADRRLVDLAHESECLKATIARQQEQINALLKQKEPEVKAGKVPEDPADPLEARHENWTCLDCTFQNIQELQECEMCGAARCQSQPSKKPRQAPAVIDVPEASPVAVRDLPDGPREFLRQATQVVEANVTSGSQHASQEDRRPDESDMCEDTCLDWSASCAFDSNGVRFTAGKICHINPYHPLSSYT